MTIAASLEFSECFTRLGASMSLADFAALDQLAAHVRDVGAVTLEGADEAMVDFMLTPDLEHVHADNLDALDEPALRTVGGVVAMFRLLAEDDGPGEGSLVPSSYIPIAASGELEYVVLVGVDQDHRGRVFGISPEGQNQTITDHDDLEEIGNLGELVAGVLDRATAR